MKRKILPSSFLFAIAIALFAYLQSCKRENAENIYVPEKDAMFASLSIANEVAENINKSDVVLKTTEKSLLKTAKYLGKRKVKNKFTISDKQKIPYLYVFNYDSGGYAIISADQRLDPNLAYGETGTFNIDSIPYGVMRWLNANAELIKYLRTTNAKQSATVNYLWSNAQCGPPPLLKSGSLLKYAPCPPNPCFSTGSSSTVGPLLKTTWDQGCGYNTYCPVLSGGPQCGHAFTGCSTTAIAQVMYYWNYPTTYNWAQMPAKIINISGTGVSDIAKLMGDIFPHVIDSYNTSGSSCSNDYNITHTF